MIGGYCHEGIYLQGALYACRHPQKHGNTDLSELIGKTFTAEQISSYIEEFKFKPSVYSLTDSNNQTLIFSDELDNSNKTTIQIATHLWKEILRYAAIHFPEFRTCFHYCNDHPNHFVLFLENEPSVIFPHVKNIQSFLKYEMHNRI
jgi:hypothetical protein